MNQTKKYLLIGGIIGLLYGIISYLGIWVYAGIPIINFVLIIPMFLTGFIGEIFPIGTSIDLGQYWIFYDGFMVILITVIFSILVSYMILKLKNRKKKIQ